MTELHINEIIAQVRAGKTEAYEEIIRRYQQDIWRTVMVMVHDGVLAESISHQAFVSAYLSIEKFDPSRDFGTWLRSIARNLAREEYRSSCREKARVIVYEQILKQDASGNEEQDDDHREVMKAALRQCREKLSEKSQHLLDLRYEQSMSLDRVAGELGRTVTATRQLLWRIRSAMRECIEKRMARYEAR